MTAVASSRTADRSRSGKKTAGFLALALVVAGGGCSGAIGGDGAGDPGTGNGGPAGPNGATPGMNGTMNGSGGPAGPGNGMGSMGGPAKTFEMFPALPGHTPMRRLTRSQYNNTIHDLLGIVGDAAGEFGVDESDAGFASNSHAPLTDILLEKYQQTAESLADQAVANIGTLLKCAPGAPEADCVDGFIRGFGKRALRRPLTDAEIGRYKTLFTKGRTGGDLASGVSLVISALLQSPSFIYRIELGDPAGATKDGLALTGYEVGTRLSYFFTESTPDDALLAAADAGKLKTPEGIAAEAQRLLTSPKGRDTMISFFQQWLGIDDLLTVEKDPKVYPVYTPEVRTAMRDEVFEFVDQVARLGDGKLSTLLTSRTSWFRGPLFPVYGLGMASNAGGSILKQMTHPADQRAGVLTLAAVQAEYGHVDQSSPVGRGKLISERLFCLVPPDPPPGVSNNIPPVDPNVSTRLRFEKHRTMPSCAACHALMDPFGVTFEIYDGMGRFRTMDGNKPVDAASEIKGTKASDGPVKNAVELVTKLSTAEETRACFTKQMFRYAFGRAETDFDKTLVTDAQGALVKSDRIPDLMIAIATAPGFRTRIPVDLR